MLAMMNDITDEENWETKVFDEAITKKWREEFLAEPALDISEKMVDEVSLTVFQLFQI